MKKSNIKDLTGEELAAALASLGEPAYRGRQVFRWLYRKAARSFDEMTDLPKELAAKLGEKFFISAPEIAGRRASSDGTAKILFRLGDELAIETVLIPAKERLTICLSTQVGCKFKCAFCASGLAGFRRNLTAAEIVDQFLFSSGEGGKITNVVFMGIGEPLDNFENVAAAIKILASQDGPAIAARKICVSTSGVIPGIQKLAAFELPVELSVSLHAATDKLRSSLMPVNKKYPLAKLIEACRIYARVRKSPVTFEYVLLGGVNDAVEDAERLAALVKGFPSKINLLRFSPVAGLRFKPPSDAAVEAFIDKLAREKLTVTMRHSKGADINAACGQLRAEAEKAPELK